MAGTPLRRRVSAQQLRGQRRASEGSGRQSSRLSRWSGESPSRSPRWKGDEEASANRPAGRGDRQTTAQEKERMMKSRVLIAGGGVASIEAALALRDLCGDRVSVEVFSPSHEFVYRPYAVGE